MSTSSFTIPGPFGQPTQSISSSSLGGDSTGTSSNIFSTSGGPPLILVFLAAGLLVGALAALIILRKFYPDRRLRGRLAQIAREDERRQKKRQELGEKPVLWDVYVASDTLDPEQLSEKSINRWDRMLPITGKFIADGKYDEESLPSPLPPPSSRPAFLKRFMNKVRPSNQQETLPLDDLKRSVDGSLQIAVAVVMPHPPSLPLSSDGEPELDYCLGLVDLPWKETVARAAISENPGEATS
ncbi:hypothetical protein QCA50_011459 [Cerrena zonata]|uniref:Uncharacterized protein n=1 Tax=Cerrena zonata TaxID=2478898 RepID=A0AAW0G269_9APHY